MKNSTNFGLLLFPTCALAAIASATGPAASANSSLENEMFGGESPTPASPATTDVSQKQPSMPPLKDSDNPNDALTLGGRLELQSSLLKSSRQEIGDTPFNHSAAAELYLDSRPNDSLRGFVKGALMQRQLGTSPEPSEPEFSLYELWIKWGGERSIYTTLGKQKLKWGAASFWNPTDFLSVQNKDPLASFDVRPGANLIKFHLPLEKLGHNFYTVVDLENAKTGNSPLLAARAEFNYGFGNWTGELTTSFAGGKDQPSKFGLDLSTALGPLDLVVESAWTRRSNQKFYQKATNEAGILNFFETDRFQQNIPQIVTGVRYDLKYSDSDSANFNLEYFWNDAGYSDVALEAYSFVQNQSPRLYLANRYVAASLFLNQPGDFNNSSLLLTTLSNLTDKSWLIRGSMTHRIDTRSRIEYAVVKAGGIGEFTGGLPEDLSAKLKDSGNLPKNATDMLDRISGIQQNLTLSVTAGIDL